VFVGTIFGTARSQLVGGQVVLAAGKKCPGIIVDTVTRWGGVRNPIGQDSVSRIFLDFGNATVGEKYAGLQTGGFAPVEHKLDVFQAGLVKSPSAAGSRNLGSPVLRSEEGIQVAEVGA